MTYYKGNTFYIPKTKVDLVTRLNNWKGWAKSELRAMPFEQLLAIYIKERKKERRGRKFRKSKNS